MTAQALAIPNIPRTNVRRFDMHRDLMAVADLVELCFQENLDADGRQYIRQMREVANNGSLLELAAAGSNRVNLPLGGFVWTEQKKVVGNISLIPQSFGNQRIYLIANVAVHPEQRRRGIAQALTQAALQEVDRRGRQPTWLQVDETNSAAIKLYSGLGFVERLRRTSWRINPNPELGHQLQSKANVRKRLPADWPSQKKWLQASYPAEVRWQLSLDTGLLQPGLLGGLQRSLSYNHVDQWSAEFNNQLRGVLSWQSSSMANNRIWLASSTQDEEQTLFALMKTLHLNLTPDRTLALNYPSGRAKEALEQAGFRGARTLIWAEYSWGADDDQQQQ